MNAELQSGIPDGNPDDPSEGRNSYKNLERNLLKTPEEFTVNISEEIPKGRMGEISEGLPEEILGSLEEFWKITGRNPRKNPKMYSLRES